METFSETFARLQPIVLNARKKYRIKLWDLDDYLQEGMLVLHKMLQVERDEASLPIHFKVRFTRHLVDILRKENSAKRLIEATKIIDISNVAFQVEDTTAKIDANLMYQDTKDTIMSHLSIKDKQSVEALLAGEKINRMQKSRLKQRLLALLDKIDEL